ncbi:DUF6869 domain-containing protein [Kangiella marina]|uniref:DUF6869 domain-containing protein n=1 Tax=Kangiella marina TaxID=1079178 RepID=A0ABP8IJ86_9GAMM
MTEIELETIANDFIKYYEEAADTQTANLYNLSQSSPYFWAEELIMDLTFESPDKLWPIILAIFAKKPPQSVIEVLAAGPLEDYLATNNEEFIVNVENRAKEDPKFASLLGGVWQNGMTEETWTRVQKVWDRSGWDGVPE